MRRKIPRRLICIFVLLSLMVFSIYKHLNMAKSLLDHNESDIMVIHRHRILTQDQFSKGLQSACVIPNLNPFSKDVSHLFKYDTGNCDVKKYGKISGGIYVLDGNGIDNVRIQYIRRHKKDGEINSDHAVSYSGEMMLKKNSRNQYVFTLKEDNIKVSMKLKATNKEHVEFHSHVARQSKERFGGAKKLSDIKSGIPMNVAMLMFDSQSRANFQRQDQKTIQFLEDDEHSFILKGHSIVGPGTPSQLSAMLTGVPIDHQRETRRGFPNTTSVDEYRWIFKNLSRAGYLTAFSEDDPVYSVFNYRMNGFTNVPTTWYLRPFFTAYCERFSNRLCWAHQTMDYLREFNEMFPHEAKFSIFQIAGMCHHTLNKMHLVDERIVELIKYFKVTRNTMFIVFGDHGPRYGDLRQYVQGKMEERLPFFSITLPEFFKSKYPKEFKALKENSKILTPHFDVYATYLHMLTYPNLPEKQLFGQSLFTPIDPIRRTCALAGVPEHYCSCLSYNPVSSTDRTVLEIAKVVVAKINKIIFEIGEKHKLCAHLELDRVKSAGIRTPKEEVIKYADELSSDSSNASHSIKSYEIVLVVLPSGGRFEANARKLKDGIITVDPMITRIDRYGSQPSCVMKEFPHVRPYCYCL